MAGKKLNEQLECGVIVNTHGVKGEVKISPWCDSPEYLLHFNRLFIDGAAHVVLSSRVHKEMVIARLEGVDNVNDAMTLKNRVVSVAREDAPLPDGGYFLSDAIGIEVYDRDNGLVGTLTDFLELPAGRIFVVKGKTEHLIPDVPDFILNVDIAAGRMTVSLIDGM